MRAIVIDDSPTMRAMIKNHLNKLGWTVVGEGENGVEALELVRTLRPDFMTLDIIMPEMDGIECYRHVRQLEQPPRCLIISVLASEPRVIAAYEGEIFSTHFLKKPYSEKELKERIDLVLSTDPMPFPILHEIGDGSTPKAEEAIPASMPELPPLPLDN
ncbi:MAG: response regulator [Oligoflexus sp.]|nr:response regulator [Oligoflexus sp.]